MKATLVVVCCLWASFLTIGQDVPPRFKHLTMADGLSQSSITCIIKDSNGFMWFGTEDGLNKYDGTNFTVYRHRPNDNTSISSSYINAIVEHKDGFLWVGTRNGLNYFNPNNETFTRYQHNPKDGNSLIHNEVNALWMNADGLLLIGTMNGLNSFRPKGKFSKHFPEDAKGSYRVKSIVEADKNHVWVLSSEMLEKVRIENGLFRDVPFQLPMKGSLKNVMARDSANLWIGTSKGLFKFNERSQTLQNLNFHDSNMATIIKDNVLSLVHGQKKPCG
ncbi:ligand-binding sensor domain-containing protein [Ulvibacterium sp.]|uniref:ligand-binding sensor domain-containing protein n=1 Tax=Ulvibacterium sp. TaxID=2665914 RepID=UPI003BA8D01F